MNFTDFSFTGGFPMDVDVFDFNHKAIRDCFAGMFPDGANMFIKGCVRDGIMGTISNGWVVIDGELMPFVGGSTIAGVLDLGVHIVEGRDNAVFFDGSNHDVFDVTRYATFNETTTGQSWISFTRYADWVIDQREAPREYEGAFTVSAHCAGGSYKFRLDKVTRLVRAYGSMTIINTGLSTTTQYYLPVLSALQGAVVPTRHVPFTLYYRYQTSADRKNYSTIDYTRQMNGEVRSDGNIIAGLVRLDGTDNYTLYFDFTYSID